MDEDNNYYFYENVVKIFKEKFSISDSITYITGHPKKEENARKQVESDRFTRENIIFENVYAIDDSTS